MSSLEMRPAPYCEGFDGRKATEMLALAPGRGGNEDPCREQEDFACLLALIDLPGPKRSASAVWWLQQHLSQRFICYRRYSSA